jgi:hypothetical protein
MVVLLVGAMSAGLNAQNDGFSQADLDAWQAIASEYYVGDIDEEKMLRLMTDPMEQNTSWAFRASDAILPGMFAPDWSLLSLRYDLITMSQYEGNQFVVVLTGSWY